MSFGKMIDDVNAKEAAETKEHLDRSRLARERREAEQKKRLDELRANAAAVQAQKERREEERRKRHAEQRAKDDDRRHQVEERKRAIWEASAERREALLQRERERAERLERARAARSTPRPAFAFGSSTPRLLEPVASSGFFWTARSTNPIDQMNFFESLAASTNNVMAASAPLTRPASALHLDSEPDNRDESDRQRHPVMWSSVARRRTDLVPTLPAPRAPETRSGETTPGSRPGSAMSSSTSVVRRTNARKPRPVSVAGTPRGGGGDMGGQSAATTAPSTPLMSRDGTVLNANGGDVALRPPAPRRPRPLSAHASTPKAADGKPPVHRKPKTSKDEKAPSIKSLSVSPRLESSLSPATTKESSVEKEFKLQQTVDNSQVSAIEVTQKLEALQNQAEENQSEGENVNKSDTEMVKKIKEENEKEITLDGPPQEKTDDSEMTASMTARRITTEEEAKAALAERRRRAREELERLAEIEKQRLQREAEEEAERLHAEEERQRREEEELRELAELQRRMEEEKLRKAIEAQQQLEREKAERKTREEVERQARLKEEEEKKKAAEEAERLRKEEAEREEKERLARKQRVEAIMARTRLRKAEEDKKQQENKTAQPETGGLLSQPSDSTTQPSDNGNAAVATADLLGFTTSQSDESKDNEAEPQTLTNIAEAVKSNNTTPNNGNLNDDLLGLSEQNKIEDIAQQQIIDNSPNANEPRETNNGNVQRALDPTANVGHISATFIQTERNSAEDSQAKLPDSVPKLIEDDFTSHNGHGTTHSHPLTLQNAI